MRPGGRPGDGPVPPAQRHRHLRRPGPDGSAVDDAAAADRRPRQLRLTGLGSGGDALHGVPDGGRRVDDDRRTGVRHGRLQAQLRRQGHRADGAAGGVSQPAGQRGQRHRGGHGHQLSAAQPGRGRAGAAAPDQAPARRHRDPASLHSRTGSAHRRQDHRAGRDPGGVRVGARVVPDPSHRPDRTGASAAQGHRGHRAAVPGRSRTGDRADQDSGHGAQAAGHRGREGPHRPGQRHPAGDRGEERVQSRCPAGTALQDDQDGGLVRHQRGGPGGRATPHAQPPRTAHRLPGAPLRGDPPADRLRPNQGGRSAAPGRGSADRHDRHRRRDRDHPVQRSRSPRRGLG